MKTYKTYILALALPLLAACGSDDNPEETTDGQTVEVNVNIGSRASTNGTTFDWTSGDQVGLSVSNNFFSVKTTTYTLTYNGSSWTNPSTVTATLPATAQAWYPATASLTKFDVPNDGTASTVTFGNYNNRAIAGTIDQSTTTGLVSADYLTSDEATVWPQLDITLRHRMTLVTVKIKAYEDFDTTPTVSDVRMYTATPLAYSSTDDKYSCEYSTSAVTWVAIKPYTTIDTANGYNTYMAIVAPYTSSTGNYPPIISMVVDGLTVYVEGEPITSGQSITYNLTVTPSKLKISSPTSSVNWTVDSGSYTGSVEI